MTLEGYHDSYSKKLGNGSVEYIQIKRITAFRNEEGKEITTQRRMNKDKEKRAAK